MVGGGPKCITCQGRNRNSRCDKNRPSCGWCVRHPDDGPCQYPDNNADNAGAIPQPPQPPHQNRPGGEPDAPMVDNRVIAAIHARDAQAQAQGQDNDQAGGADHLHDQHFRIEHEQDDRDRSPDRHACSRSRNVRNLWIFDLKLGS